MTVTINGSTGIDTIQDGVVAPADLTTGAPSWNSLGVFSFNSGYGSAATAYGCRAWVNFNGTGTVAIRGSGNVSSVTDISTGQYTVNFTIAMPDANYSAVGTVSDLNAPGGNESYAMLRGSLSASNCPVDAIDYVSNNIDVPFNCWSFFR
jgi:hypothetical protein